MSTNQPANQKPEETVVPDWVSSTAHYFRWGLTIFLLLSAVMGMAGCSAQAFGTTWASYSQALEASEVTQILANNSMLTQAQVTADQIEAVTVFPIDDLILVNLNSADLCGHSHCLYLGYTRDSNERLKEVFNANLDPNLPPGYALFESSERRVNGLPCFTINQVNRTDIDRYTLCFDGSTYQVDDVKSAPSEESNTTKTSRASVILPR